MAGHAGLPELSAALAEAPASDADELAFSTDEAAAREVRPKQRGRLLAIGGAALLIGAALLSAAATSGPELTASDGLEDNLEEAWLKPFKKCGGEGYTGKTCCKPGCACVIHTQYYHQCEAPSGMEDCDQSYAKDQVKAVQRKASEAEMAIKAAKSELDAAQATEAASHQAAAEAKEEWRRAKKVGAAKRKVKEHAHQAALRARVAANVSAKAAAAKAVEYEKVSNASKGWIKAAEMRKHGHCVGMFKPCMNACCEEGCLCRWTNEFFAQCSAPEGRQTCDPPFETQERNKAKEHMKRLAAELKHLKEVQASKVRTAEEKEARAAKMKHEAILAGTDKTNAHDNSKLKDREEAEAVERTERAKKAHEDCVKMQGNGKLNIEAWKKVRDQIISPECKLAAKEKKSTPKKKASKGDDKAA